MPREFEQPDRWDVASRHYEATAHPFTSRFAEAALAQVPLSATSDVLDVAAGTGALALAAARTGAQVLATDFSPGMIARLAATAPPNVETRVMDGQALDLPDAGFDAAFSIFGVIMFADWRQGLREMARVTRPGGYGVVATWTERGAATFLLLGQVLRTLFPEHALMAMPEAIGVLSEPGHLEHEMIAAGYQQPQITSVTYDYELQTQALDEPDKLFGTSPDWTGLSSADRAAVVAKIKQMAGHKEILPIPSTALIAVARR